MCETLILIYSLWVLSQEAVVREALDQRFARSLVKRTERQPQLAVAPAQDGQGRLDGDRVGGQPQEVAAKREQPGVALRELPRCGRS